MCLILYRADKALQITVDMRAAEAEAVMFGMPHLQLYWLLLAAEAAAV